MQSRQLARETERVQIVENRNSRYLLVAVIVLALVGCDQVTKTMATEQLRDSGTISLLGDSIRLQYVQNAGAFLGAGSGLSGPLRFWIITVFSVGMLAVLAALLVVKPIRDITMLVAFALLLAGGIGNSFDRIFHDGLVTDFMNVGIGPVRTGIFNVADVAITTAALLIVYRTLRPVGQSSPIEAEHSSPQTG